MPAQASLSSCELGHFPRSFTCGKLGISTASKRTPSGPSEKRDRDISCGTNRPWWTRKEFSPGLWSNRDRPHNHLRDSQLHSSSQLSHSTMDFCAVLLTEGGVKSILILVFSLSACPLSWNTHRIRREGAAQRKLLSAPIQTSRCPSHCTWDTRIKC